jgi:hypothetical protein
VAAETSAGSTESTESTESAAEAGESTDAILDEDTGQPVLHVPVKKKGSRKR